MFISGKNALEPTAGNDSSIIEGMHYDFLGGNYNGHELSEGNCHKDVDITWLADYFRRLLGRRDSGRVLVNYNVLLMVILSFGYGVAESLWTDTILVVYLKDVSVRDCGTQVNSFLSTFFSLCDCYLSSSRAFLKYFV